MIKKGDLFIRKVIEAVSPIIPISLRNRSLDGGYLRTVLALLEAKETLFSLINISVGTQTLQGAVGMEP